MKTKEKKETTKGKPVFDYKTIKSFEDACKKLNLDPEKLPDVTMVPEEFRKAIINGYKLYIIYKAINDGWAPNWNNSSEWKYYPWFWVDASAALSSGFSFSTSYCHYTYASTTVGSRLCTDSSEKALYIAKTFQDEYKEFFLIQQ
jgi:hypothetical protein